MIDISTIDAKTETPKMLGIAKAQIELSLAGVIDSPTISEQQKIKTVSHEITERTLILGAHQKGELERAYESALIWMQIDFELSRLAEQRYN